MLVGVGEGRGKRSGRRWCALAAFVDQTRERKVWIEGMQLKPVYLNNERDWGSIRERHNEMVLDLGFSEAFDCQAKIDLAGQMLLNHPRKG